MKRKDFDGDEDEGEAAKKPRTDGARDGDGDAEPQEFQDKNQQKRGRNAKGSLLTISKKMEILKKFEEFKSNGAKHPEKAGLDKFPKG